MENNLFQQAKSAISRLINAQKAMSEDDRKTAKETIERAYSNCTVEEKDKLQQFEQSHETNKQLS